MADNAATADCKISNQVSVKYDRDLMKYVWSFEITDPAARLFSTMKTSGMTATMGEAIEDIAALLEGVAEDI